MPPGNPAGYGLIDPALLADPAAGAGAIDPAFAAQAAMALQPPQPGQGFLPPGALADASTVFDRFQAQQPQEQQLRDFVAADDSAAAARRQAGEARAAEIRSRLGQTTDPLTREALQVELNRLEGPQRRAESERMSAEAKAAQEGGGEEQQAEPQGFVFFDPNRGAASRPAAAGPRFATARQSVTQTTSTGVDPTPLQQTATASADTAKESVIEQADVMAEGEQRVAEAARTAARVNAEAAAEVRDISREARAASNKLLGDIRAVSDEIGKGEIDPDRLWADKGTGAKIGAAIFAGLGALGSAMTGGPNSALQIIQTAIDRDIDAQKANFQAKRAKLEDLKGVYAVARSMTDDAIEQEDVARTLALEGVKSQLQEIGATTQSELVKARVGELLAGIDQQLVQLQGQIAQSVADRTVTTTTEKTVPVGGGGAEMRDDGGIPGLQVVDPEAFQHLDKVEKRKVRESASALRSMQDAVGQLVSLREEYGTEVLPSEVSGEYEAAKTQVIAALTQLANTGVLNEGEFQRFSKLIPGIGLKASDALRVFGKDATLEQLRGFRTQVLRSANKKLEAFGVALQGTTPNPLQTAERGVE